VKTLYLAGLCLLVSVNVARAASDNLLESYEQAKQFDPQFLAARSERQSNLIASKISRSALYPEARISSSQLETENSLRNTLSITQPLFNLDRYATYKEAAPRETIAEATYHVREQDLAARFFAAVSELVRAREGLVLNQAKIDAIDLQSKSAQRTYELGTGTITDVRDAQVRLDQARAAHLTLRARRSAAERQFAAITGNLPAASAFVLVKQKPEVFLLALDAYLGRAVQDNPNVVVARQNERIAELGMVRARGAWLPQVNASMTQSRTATGSNNNVGVSLAFPLQAGSFYQVSNARANVDRSVEQTREAEQRIRLEVEKLRELVEAGRYEVEMRLEGIRTAELSVEANEKSFSGGIRTKLDVINSIQLLYQTKEEHLNAVLTLADNLLKLYIQMAMPIPEALKQVQTVLFIPR
jgi:protease secretion system outer membrane protein